MSKIQRDNIREAIARRFATIYDGDGCFINGCDHFDRHVTNTEKVLGMLLHGPVTVRHINTALDCNDGGRYVRFLSEAGYEIRREWVGESAGEKSHKVYSLPDAQRQAIIARS